MRLTINNDQLHVDLQRKNMGRQEQGTMIKTMRQKKSRNIAKRIKVLVAKIQNLIKNHPGDELTKRRDVNKNIYVSLEKVVQTSTTVLEPVFKIEHSECPSCIFGDPSLTCTCNFRSGGPDFKLYEDEDKFLRTYSTGGLSVENFLTNSCSETVK